MKLDIEEDRSIASLRTLEPKLKNVSKIPKAKKTRPTKKHLEDNNHYHLGELLRKYKAEKLISNFIKKMSRNVPSNTIPEAPLFY